MVGSSPEVKEDIVQENKSPRTDCQESQENLVRRQQAESSGKQTRAYKEGLDPSFENAQICWQ
jgi:hypothetical protein